VAHLPGQDLLAVSLVVARLVVRSRAGLDEPPAKRFCPAPHLAPARDPGSLALTLGLLAGGLGIALLAGLAERSERLRLRSAAYRPPHTARSSVGTLAVAQLAHAATIGQPEQTWMAAWRSAGSGDVQ
jgi:hypothetical protein